MATSFISTAAELVFLNTSARPGVVILPSTNVPGRILTFKDRSGTSLVSSITFSTSAAAQFLENNANRLTVTNPFGAYSFVTGTDNKWYTIGGSQMYAALISSITTQSFNTLAISTGSVTTSTLQMRDTQTTSTNTIFFQSSVLYYSSPINFFVIGPSKAPKPLFTPIRAPFIPTQIVGSILWLDAADPGVFTGGARWIDKSGTNNTGVNGTPGSTTMPSITIINGLNAARFVAANANSMVTTNQIPAYSVTYFLVVRVNALATPTIQQFIMINNTDGARQVETITSTFPAAIQYTLDTATYPTILTVNQSQLFMVSITIPVSGGIGNLYANGSISASSSQAVKVGTGNSTHFFGSANGTSGYSTCDIGEILIYNTTFADAQRQQVEGYLAWKWGLVSQLPSAHPYKNSPP